MLFAATAFLSALLLFLVQPMIAREMLPWFGGAAGVWTTSMLFFQVVLLLGYVYADLATRLLRPPVRMAVHFSLLALSLTALPIALAPRWSLGESFPPAVRVLATLIALVGLPYFLLSSTGPLVQSWRLRFAGTSLAYRLFAVSNAASLAGLVAYPVAIEPLLSIRQQTAIWSAAYVVFVALTAAAAWLGLRSPGPDAAPWDDKDAVAPDRATRALWIGLAACPSILWLAVSNTLSQHVAPIPFLWILPLTIYLLTFVLCFHRPGFYNPSIFRFLLPVGWVLFNIAATNQGVQQLQLTVGLFSAGLFICCMFCHGELARRKPAAGKHLTSFYVTVALGGAIGGVLVGAVAPMLFRELLELPIGVGLSIALATGLLYRFPLWRIVRLAAAAAVGLAAVAQISGLVRHVHYRERNFYGILEVKDVDSPGGAMRVLDNGPIRHGAQFLSAEKRSVPTGYYGTDSGIGIVLRSYGSKALNVGVIGLGAGTLAAYCRPGDTYRFYEINPAVIQVARSEFRFLRDCPDVAVVEGDARLALEREPGHGFDVLAVDAFNGDSVPVHLLTQEAFALYFRHLKPDGILAVHVSNRYLDLSVVVRQLAAFYSREARLFRSPPDPQRQLEPADWVLVSPDPALWRRIPAAASPILATARGALWTDDHTDLFRILR